MKMHTKKKDIDNVNIDYSQIEEYIVQSGVAGEGFNFLCSIPLNIIHFYFP